MAREPHQRAKNREIMAAALSRGANLSAHWCGAEAADNSSILARTVAVAASGLPELTLTLVSDRKFGRHERLEYLQQRGVYVLFYNNGKVARLGQAGARPLGKRLLDYDADQHRWFVFRWIAVTPCAGLPRISLIFLRAQC